MAGRNASPSPGELFGKAPTLASQWVNMVNVMHVEMGYGS
jgi:hypothetical protein